ncbi:MAG TPA: GAF domain-containing protein [Phototrophicaceae bacterium]|nr:GAF domain-containing protein [Phototrophicaceae bacterium]
MRRMLDNLFDTSMYTNDVERDRARTIYLITFLFIIVYTPLIFFVSAGEGSNQGSHFFNHQIFQGLILIVFYLSAGMTIWALQQENLKRAEMIPLATLLAGSLLTTWPNGFQGAAGGINLIVFIALAGFLLRERGLIVGLAVALVGLVVSILAAGTTAVSGLPREFFTTLILLPGATAMIYLQMSTNVGQSTGIRSVSNERLQLAEITSQVAQRIARRTALQEVLNNAVEQICSEYSLIYHAQIFLVNDQQAQLSASTGEVGRLLLGRKHSLPVGSQSVIGQVTANNKSVISRAGWDSVHRRNEFLPDTAAEAAFPLRLGDKVIGALDLQSKTATAFREDDVPIFQSLADHLAIAIDNARLFEETEHRMRENQQLVEQTRRAAEEVERLNQQLTRRFWSDYLSQYPQDPALTVDFIENITHAESPWTNTLQAAAQSNDVVQVQQDGVNVVAVPLRVRGQVIGAMEFELDVTGQLTPEDLNLIQEVGERLGMAAESNRLFEASQNVAQREALVNEIATQLQASNTVEMTLSAAARSLKETMKASRVAIRLGPPPTTANQVKQGSGL